MLSSLAIIDEESRKTRELVKKIGHGIVFFGSSRVCEGSIYLERASTLGRQVGVLLDRPLWTGGGPGMMEAVSKGAIAAGCRTGAVSILPEDADESAEEEHPYLQQGTFIYCRTPLRQKVGLVEAGERKSSSDVTAYIILPGGLGTLYELLEVITLAQIRGKDSKALQIPVLVMNYDDFYEGMLSFLAKCVESGTVENGNGSLDQVVVACDTNLQALEYLADFYDVSPEKRRTFQDARRSSRSQGRFLYVPTSLF
eukprot:jgi/Mesvir1/20953/Mv08024-RA.1